MFFGTNYSDIYYTLTTSRLVIWNGNASMNINATADSAREERVFRTQAESLIYIDMGADYGSIHMAYRVSDLGWNFSDVQPTGLATPWRIFSCAYNPVDDYLYAMLRTTSGYTIYARVLMDTANPAWQIIATGSASVGMLSGVQLDYSEKFVVAIHHATLATQGIFYKDATVWSGAMTLGATGSFRYPLFCHFAAGLFGGSAGYHDSAINIIDQLTTASCRASTLQMPGMKAQGYLWDSSTNRISLAAADIPGSSDFWLYRYEPSTNPPSLPYVVCHVSPFLVTDVTVHDIDRNFRAVRHDYFILMGTFEFSTAISPPVEYRFGGTYNPYTHMHRSLLITDIQRTTANYYSIGNTDTEAVLFGASGACHVMSDPGVRKTPEVGWVPE
jgi:hypothetical protein